MYLEGIYHSNNQLITRYLFIIAKGHKDVYVRATKYEKTKFSILVALVLIFGGDGWPGSKS